MSSADTHCGQGVRQAGFLGASALLFIASTAATIAWCAAMPDMGEMPMPGGWTMSMAWLPSCGQSWLGLAASFIGMWGVMMVAMMLPSLMPILWRYRLSVGGLGAMRLDGLTLLVGLAYFAVWLLIGMGLFPLGAMAAAAEMQSSALASATPLADGVAMLLAGAVQFSAWKAQRLACCRAVSARTRSPADDPVAALRHGLRLGLDCAQCCANLTVALLVFGVMDLRAMILVSAAISAERLAPAGEQVARASGGIMVAMGFYLLFRAAGIS